MNFNTVAFRKMTLRDGSSVFRCDPCIERQRKERMDVYRGQTAQRVIEDIVELMDIHDERISTLERKLADTEFELIQERLRSKLGQR